MYIKGYISNEKFEEWVYDNSELLERDFAHIYLDLISANYRNKEAVIAVTARVREHGIDPVVYNERNKKIAQISYTQETYEKLVWG